MGLFDLAFCAGVLAIGRYALGLDVPTLQTLTLVTLVFNGQAVFYTVRERRRLWSSRPSTLVILCSVADILLVPTLAVGGVLMAPLPVTLVAGVAAAAVVLAFTLDGVKALMFGWLKVA